MEHHSAITKNEILSFSAIQMEWEYIMLNEIRHAEKDKYYSVSLKCGIQKNNKLANKTKKQQIHRHKEQTRAWTPLWRGRGEGALYGQGGKKGYEII